MDFSTNIYGFEDGKISAHFTEKDFTCNCGCRTFFYDSNLIQLLEYIRAYIWEVMGYECYIIVHCTVRCKEHNTRIGGVSESRHLPKYFKQKHGACDFHVRGITNKKLRQICKKLWWDRVISGLGLYDWGVHVDTSTRRRWGSLWNEIVDKIDRIIKGIKS